MSEMPALVPDCEETALYHIFGDVDLLLYIGMSNDFGRRWKEHAKTQPWWDEKRQMVTVWFESRVEAEDAETAAIKVEHPKYNKHHNAIAKQYHPVRPRIMRNCMYVEELYALPSHVDLETAGRAWSLGRTASYDLARRDEFPCPVHRRGRYYRVLKAELMTSLGLQMDGTPIPASVPSPAREEAA